MDKHIDFNTSFIHGFPFATFDDIALKKLDSILESNYLYCMDDIKKINPKYTFFPIPEEALYNKTSEVCLSVHPTSLKYSHKNGNSDSTFKSFSNQTFYLVFKEEIMKDFNIREGILTDEYYLSGSIPVKEYLVGIGNSGLQVNYRLNTIYNFFRYYNKEITFDEFILFTGKYNCKDMFDLNKIEHISEVVDLYSYITYKTIDGKVLPEFKINSDEYYLEKYRYYNRLKELCLQYKLDMYDSNGIFIEESNMLPKIEEMKKYTCEQLEATADDRKKYLLSKKNY